MPPISAAAPSPAFALCEADVQAIRRAAQDLVARRHLLAQDAERLIAEAARDGWTHRP